MILIAFFIFFLKTVRKPGELAQDHLQYFQGSLASDSHHVHIWLWL